MPYIFVPIIFNTRDRSRQPAYCQLVFVWRQTLRQLIPKAMITRSKRLKLVVFSPFVSQFWYFCFVRFWLGSRLIAPVKIHKHTIFCSILLSAAAAVVDWSCRQTERGLLMIKLKIDSRSQRSLSRSFALQQHYVSFNKNDGTTSSSVAQVERATCDSWITFQYLL